MSASPALHITPLTHVSSILGGGTTLLICSALVVNANLFTHSGGRAGRPGCAAGDSANAEGCPALGTVAVPVYSVSNGAETHESTHMYVLYHYFCTNLERMFFFKYGWEVGDAKNSEQLRFLLGQNNVTAVSGVMQFGR